MKSKCLMLVAVLFLSQVIIEVHDDSVSVTAAQDVEVNVPPVVEILPDVSRGMAPLIVHFDG
ncbi:MAG: hypothetical protein HXS46_01060, partial [Theionarchaea archaeon]|nr:hypothetical protein [Theionarchaea archaeon]